MLRPLLAIAALGLSSPLLAQQPAGPDVEAPGAADYRADAEALHGMIALYYAYSDRFPGNAIPTNPLLQREAAAVADRRALLRYAERALLLLRDHHAITGSSFADSWALVPSYSDLWIEYEDGRYRIDAVREGSPAAAAGAVPGMELTAIAGEPIDAAVAAFWADLGESAATDRLSRSFAARVLAAGRRNRPRDLTMANARGEMHVTIPSLYAIARTDRAPVSIAMEGNTASIRFNDSLGDDATIAAFDQAMEEAIAGGASALLLDLTDTPSGGNTLVARGVMGWFAREPAPIRSTSCQSRSAVAASLDNGRNTSCRAKAGISAVR